MRFSAEIEEDLGVLQEDSSTAEPAERYRRLVRLHGKLSERIAPATPRSLAATRFAPRDPRSLQTYGLLFLLAVAAITGIVMYANLTHERVPSAEHLIEVERAKGTLTVAFQDSVTTEVARAVKRQRDWLYFYAALLGAGFNGLLTAYRYFRNRSFDPYYVPVYIVRLVIGVVAGFVLGNIGYSLLEGESTLAKLGPAVIAMLGGYSAEAVRQVLDRLVEVLVTTVRGKEEVARRERLAFAEEVLAVAKTAAEESGTPPAVREKIEGLMKSIKS
jgi:hypothetical protein